MYKLTLSFLAIICLSQFTYSQSSVSGIVKDTSARTGVKNAVVAFLTPVDSALMNFTRTNNEGGYRISNIKPGKYIVMVMHPVFADYVEDIEVTSETITLPTFPVTPKSKLLEAVILKSGSPIRIKGDTTIYTADSFNVSANANVEELLKKLPGIQVDKNGQITAMGQTVEKVLVDGEEFFGDDPGMAVKNLRADAVKEVQVFDKKSEQSEFTGIDDGQTKKTINLKLKEDKKKGYFGKIGVAGGLQDSIDHRFNNNLMLSSFKGKRKIAGFFLNGNTGQDGLSWQDNEKFGGESDNVFMSFDDDGGSMISWRGGGTDDEPYVNTENGFIKNINAGLQYSNKWNDKKTLSISPKYNSQIYDNDRETFTQSQVGETVLNERSFTKSYVNRNNIKSSAVYDLKIDTSNTLKVTLRANFYHTENEELGNSFLTGRLDSLKNTSENYIQSKNDKYSLSSSVIFKHKFKKAKRTLSLNADWNMLSLEGNNLTNSKNEFYQNGAVSSVIEQNNMRDNNKSTQKVSSRLVLTEPINKKYSLEVSHEVSYNTGKNNQTTYSYSPTSGKYDEMVDSLTNDFDQTILVNKPSARINYADKKLKVNIGAGLGFTHFNLADKTLNKDYIRNYTNFFPSANFTYTYKANSSLRVNYSGNTTQPTINQLQPLRNNTNLINQYIGNPNLRPSFGNSLGLSHNSYDFIKDKWTYQSLNFRLTSNSITNNRIIDTLKGTTTTQPINTDGNLSINFWSGIGFKMKKLNTRINFNPNINYNRFADVINNKTSFAKTLNAGLSINIQKSKDKKYDLSVNNAFSYFRNVNNQKRTKTNYNTYNLSLNGTVYHKKVWSINTEYEMMYRQKTPEFSNNLQNQLWNARLQRTFNKNEFTAYVLVRDILNQNIGIERNFNGNTLTETRNDRLRRYWMLGFTWDFKNKAAKTK
ncbi:MAG: outer membrane beta-barrel family protein [Ferruginibacter sp.]